MITLEKEKVTINPDIKVIKRDGRMVVFDSSKIYEAILKASEAITPITPLIEAKLDVYKRQPIRSSMVEGAN